MVSKKETKWTPELVEQLKNLYLDKSLSTFQIAQKLGFTKNAVIGKLHRMDLTKNKEETDIKAPITEDFEYNSVVQNILHHVGNKATKGEYTLENIRRNMCVYPSDTDENFTFCGDTVVKGKNYCKDHLDKVYLTIKKVNKRDNIYTEEDLTEDEIVVEEIVIDEPDNF